MKYLLALLVINSAFAQNNKAEDSWERIEAIRKDSSIMFNRSVSDPKTKKEVSLWSTDLKTGEFKVTAHPDMKISEVGGKQVYSFKDKAFVVQQKTKLGSAITTLEVGPFDDVSGFSTIYSGPEGTEALSDCNDEGCLYYSPKTCVEMVKLGQGLMKNDQKIKDCIATLGESDKAYENFNNAQYAERLKYSEEEAVGVAAVDALRETVPKSTTLGYNVTKIHWVDSPNQNIQKSMQDMMAIATKCQILIEKGILKKAALEKEYAAPAAKNSKTSKQ